MSKDLPEWSDYIAKGTLDPILNWLADAIMSKGALYDPADLVRHVTGGDLDAGPFLDFLEHKYSHMFGF
jgi:carboxypeptidase Taq